MFIAAVQGYPQPLEEPSRWSAEFAAFLGLCLRLDPKARPTVDEILLHPFLRKGASRDDMKALIMKLFRREEPLVHIKTEVVDEAQESVIHV